MTTHGDIFRFSPAPLLREMTRDWAPFPDQKIIAAVSGGADSVALLRLLAALAPGRGWTVEVATLDHGLRGEHGAADRRFVEALAADLGLLFHSASILVERRARESQETAARRVRRQFLEATAKDRGAAAVALGHTLDDQAETVLFRLGRGTGLLGLGGMRRWTAPFWRPLLGVRRTDLRQLLHDTGQSWREDETNSSLEPARNRIRLRLLPEVERNLGQPAIEALGRAAQLAADDEDFLSARAADAAAGVLHDRGIDWIELDRKALSSLPPALSRRILRNYCADLGGARGRLGSDHLLALERLSRGETPGTRFCLPHGLAARRAGRVLIISRAQEAGER